MTTAEPTDRSSMGSSPPGGQRRAEIVVPVRHYGRWVSGAIVLLLFAFLLTTIAHNRAIDFGLIPRYVFNSAILAGVRRTLLLTVFAMLLAIALGTITAVARLSVNPVLSSVGWFYVWFFRGTPVLVQLIFWFNIGVVFPTLTLKIPFGGPILWSSPTNHVITSFGAALLGLGLNEGAYYSEIVRAGIISVDPGQTLAAQALGMTRFQVMFRIILPQASRVIVPPTGNETIGMLKYTSLASVISYNELLGSAQNIYSTNLRTLELLTVASIWYLICTSALSSAQFFLERHLAAGSGLVSRKTLAERAIKRLWSTPRYDWPFLSFPRSRKGLPR